MSRAQRDAYHAARLLQNELARIASKRDRQIAKANGDFQLDLIQTVALAAPSTLTLVRQVLREDVAQLHLSRALETLVAPPDDDERSERETEPPVFELRQPRRPVVDGNEAWGMPAQVVDGEFEEVAGRLEDAPDAVPGLLEPMQPSHYPPSSQPLPARKLVDDLVVIDDGPPAGYRYPEPGEPAIELPDGTVVFDASAPSELPL